MATAAIADETQVSDDLSISAEMTKQLQEITEGEASLSLLEKLSVISRDSQLDQIASVKAQWSKATCC